MKFVYCHCSVYNPGGMERVLLNKVTWLSRHGHEVVVVTTDQDGRATFYDFPEGVRMIDLGINYSADKSLPPYKKIANYIWKRSLHKRRLAELLLKERPDITVSLYPSESAFIPSIKDGSKKVLELHFNRFFRLQYGRKGMLGMIDRIRSRQDTAIARRFDSFVVLTEEDKGYWGDTGNICVIPNAAMRPQGKFSDGNAKRVIAVGRLDYQKGFDRLLRIWAKVKEDKSLADWRLDIFGQGEWRGMLEDMAKSLGISDSVAINRPVKDIADEYRQSSILAMTSNYEGFPMVMIEAMAEGLPVVAYDFKCGPKDIIKNNFNGKIIKEGDEQAFADALAYLMTNANLRKKMGSNARSVIEKYSEEAVMQKWLSLFQSLPLNQNPKSKNQNPTTKN